jgi:nucleotide-binding universal stress UspA family protein
VVENIIEEAKSEDYDLVIIGPHTQKGWEHYLLDDLTKAIIGQIDRHVLVV